MGMVAALAKLGDEEGALGWATRIVSHRYQTVALCDAGREFGERQKLPVVKRLADKAENNFEKITGEFARDYARICLSELRERIGEMERAFELLDVVKAHDFRARALWRMWSHSRTNGRMTIWSEASVATWEGGEAALSEMFFQNAIDVVRGMCTRWWRARALSRLAKTMLTLNPAKAGR